MLHALRLLVVVLAAAAVPAHAGGWAPSWMGLAGGAGGGASDDAAPGSKVLRVCADPDNLPFSRRDGSGFENRIAALMAQALGARLEYVWTPPQRALLRRTLGADACDLLVGVRAGSVAAATTRPYYRSGYVFATRADAAPLAGFGDARLAQWRIGVPLGEHEAGAAAPGLALARAGAGENLVGYARGDSAPAAARMVEDLARGALDAALLWGPQAGWYAGRSGAALRLQAPDPPSGMQPALEASIAMGVRPGRERLRAALDAALDAHRAQIDAILRSYGVPRLDGGPPTLLSRQPG